MCLTRHNQLTLLHDLLHEQLTLKSVTLNEYTQIKKLIQQLITDRTIEDELQMILPEIYNYGIKAELAASFDTHIQAYEHRIPTWIEIIQQTKGNICS